MIQKIADVELSASSYSYDGVTHKPTVTVKDSTGNTLVKNTDYTLSYEDSNSRLAGRYELTLTFKGKYSDTITKTYSIDTPTTSSTITKCSNVSNGIKVEWSEVENAEGYILYRDNSKMETLSGGSTLLFTDTGAVESGRECVYKVRPFFSGKDGAWAYGKNSKAKYTKYIGMAEVTLSNRSTGVKIAWKNVTGATSYYIYLNGRRIKAITSGSTLSYTATEANVNGSEYKVMVRAYRSESDGTKYLATTSAEKKIFFLKRQAISSLSSSTASRVKVTCTKNTAATHYQIMYSKDKSFPASGAKKYAIKSIDASVGTTKTITSLDSGKTYYFKVRSYKKLLDGTKSYGSWSTVKRITVK